MKVEYVPVRCPAWGWRLFATAILFLSMLVANQAYKAVGGATEGELAVKQLSEDPQERAIGRAAAQANLPGLVWAIAGGGLLAVWVPYAYGLVRYTMAIDGDNLPA